MVTADTPLFQRLEAIREWQVTATPGSEAAVSTAVIATLFDGILGFFTLLLRDCKEHRSDSSEYRSLEKNAAALFFWGRDHGVSQGDLDMALQYSHCLRDTVLAVLVSLGQFMIGVRILPTKEHQDAVLGSTKISGLAEDLRLSLDEPFEKVDYTNLSDDDLFSILESKIESLHALNSSLETPAEDEIDDEESRTWSQLQDRSAYEYFIDLVSSRFPLAEKQLAEHLGQSNWDRYKYVQKQKHTVHGESVVVDTEKAKSEFHDSGIGSSASTTSITSKDQPVVSLRTQSDCAATVISSRADASHRRLPPLPAEGRSGAPFQCEICNRTVQMRRPRDWRTHVFDDICAYNCIFLECSQNQGLFRDRKALTDHLASYHGIDENTVLQVCPLCLDGISGGLASISLHLARHMEEIALAILPQATDSDVESSSDDETNTAVLSENERECSAKKQPEQHSNNKEGAIRCICGSTEDTDRLILCNNCSQWQHSGCYYATAIPEIHFCTSCSSTVSPEFTKNRSQPAQPGVSLVEKAQYKNETNISGSLSATEHEGLGKASGSRSYACPFYKHDTSSSLHNWSCIKGYYSMAGLRDHLTWFGPHQVEESRLEPLPLDCRNKDYISEEQATWRRWYVALFGTENVPSCYNEGYKDARSDPEQPNGTGLQKCRNCHLKNKECDGAKPLCNPCIDEGTLCLGYSWKYVAPGFSIRPVEDSSEQHIQNLSQRQLLELSTKFHEYYLKYEELHQKLTSSITPPTENQRECLLKMHKKLKEMKQVIKGSHSTSINYLGDQKHLVEEEHADKYLLPILLPKIVSKGGERNAQGITIEGSEVVDVPVSRIPVEPSKDSSPYRCRISGCKSLPIDFFVTSQERDEHELKVHSIMYALGADTSMIWTPLSDAPEKHGSATPEVGTESEREFGPHTRHPQTPTPSGNGSDPWRHHHYISASSQDAFPQSHNRYICSTCNKAFSRPSSLRIHSHSHAGEKPYKCLQPGCGKAFSVRSNLKRHERNSHASTIPVTG